MGESVAHGALEAERVQPGDGINVRAGAGPDHITVNRYGPLARLNHWIIAASLIVLAISGLALYSPDLFFLTALFGGGQNTRAFHPWIGVLLFVSFFVFFFQLWRANLPLWVDVVWMSKFKDVVAGREENLPELGKYNAGQKVVFWGMAGLIIVLIASGVVIWNEFFENATSIDTRRWAALIHSLAAVAAICVFIMHVYAAIWTRGTLRAMTRGTVTGGWAWRHHRKWLRELNDARRVEKPKPGPAE